MIPALSLSAEENIAHDFWGIGPSFGISGGWSLAESQEPEPHRFVLGRFLVRPVERQRRLRQDRRPTSGSETYGAFTTSMKDSCLGVPVLRYFLGLEWVHQGQRHAHRARRL